MVMIPGSQECSNGALTLQQWRTFQGSYRRQTRFWVSDLTEFFSRVNGWRLALGLNCQPAHQSARAPPGFHMRLGALGGCSC